MKHGLFEASDNGFIVVETNYRIYAYTSMCSLFHALLLSGFAFVQYLLLLILVGWSIAVLCMLYIHISLIKSKLLPTMLCYHLENFKKLNIQIACLCH